MTVSVFASVSVSCTGAHCRGAWLVPGAAAGAEVPGRRAHRPVWGGAVHQVHVYRTVLERVRNNCTAVL